MVSIVRDCCDALLSIGDDFWLVALLTGWSFETGGSAKFRKAVRTFVDAGLPAPAVDLLGKGVNGNLIELIERRHPGLRSVRGNRGHGNGTRPDFHFGPAGAADEVVGEVKAVYDLTTPGFYGHKDGHGVADDRVKLLGLRADGFAGQLYQVVFFAQLPRFDCPAGCWDPPTWKHRSFAWREYPGKRGIEAQYRYLRTLIGDAPLGEPDGLTIRQLGEPSKAAAEAMSRRFAAVFRPDPAGWCFDPPAHLAGAAVGYAIWTY